VTSRIYFRSESSIAEEAVTRDRLVAGQTHRPKELYVEPLRFGLRAWEGVTMRQRIYVPKVKREPQRRLPDLSERMAELRRLKRQVRLAEAALQPKAALSKTLTV
jgi:hypothetical protein